MAGNAGSVNLLFEADEPEALNSEGRQKADEIGQVFTDLLGQLAAIVGQTNSREFSLVQTKLQEACFYARRAVALQGGNRQAGQ